jgi:ankyrin repeat protein
MPWTRARLLNVAVGACSLVAAVLLFAQAILRNRPAHAIWAVLFALAGLTYFLAVGLYRWLRWRRSPEHRIHRLINEGDEAALRQLLRQYDGLEGATDGHGGTPLHRAALQGRDGMAAVLIEAGADVNGREDLFGFTPLHLVACRTYRPVVAALHPELDRCDFARADEGAGRRVALVLLEAGAEVNVSAGFSRTPLHMACVAGGAELVNLLIERGANVDVRDDMGFSPLHYAAFGGDGRVATLLVEAGADFSACAELDYTPLHTAAEKGATEVARVLLDAGADASRETTHSRTPFALANQHGHGELAELIGRHEEGRESQI